MKAPIGYAMALAAIFAACGTSSKTTEGSSAARSGSGGAVGEGDTPADGGTVFEGVGGGARMTGPSGGSRDAGGGAGSVGAPRPTPGAGTTGGGASSGGTLNTGGQWSGAAGAETETGGATQSSAAGNPSAGTAGTGAAGDNASGPCVESHCGSHKWACWKMPNPTSSPEGVPNRQRYTDLGNGAVRDDITCLVWEKANPSVQGNWQSAHDRCADLAAEKFAGFDDWRLPTRVEMASITDVTRGSTGYPEEFTVTTGYYVTGSFWYKTILTKNNANPEDRVWGYGTNGFTSNAMVRSNTNNVARCVRGNGTGEAADAYAEEPPDHYTVTGAGNDAIVTDHYTGLMWQQTFSSSRMAWSAAAGYCASQTTGGLSGWRLPTLNELASTVNEAVVTPAINRSVFPKTVGSCDETGWYWAAEASKVGGTAWGISYCDGYTGWSVTDTSKWNYFTDAYVRCVR